MSKRRRYRLIRTDTRAYIWKYLRNFNVFKNFPWCRLAKFIELTFPNVISFYVSRGLKSKLTVTNLFFEVERTTIIISRLLMGLFINHPRRHVLYANVVNNSLKCAPRWVLISNSFSERLFEPVREHLNWGKSRWKVEAKVENSPFRGLRKLLPFFPIRVRAK